MHLSFNQNTFGIYVQKYKFEFVTQFDLEFNKPLRSSSPQPCSPAQHTRCFSLIPQPCTPVKKLVMDINPVIMVTVTQLASPIQTRANTRNPEKKIS